MGTPHGPRHVERSRRPRLFGIALTPANCIGVLLFFGFISTLFTASPFEPFNHPSGSGGSGGGEGGGLGAWAKWRGSYVNVPRDSHAYLQAAFPGAGPESFTHNVSRLWDAAAAQLAGQASYFGPWIAQDLQPWAKTGITKDLVEAAAQLYDTCDGEMIRAQVLGGALFVHHVTDRRNGWYPAVLGPGNLAAKGRVPYAILGLMDALRLFPGQIPDADFVLHTADFACVKRSWSHGGGGAPQPLLGFQGSPRHLDLPFPDYAHWGHEHQYLQACRAGLEDPWGHPAHSWAAQELLLRRKYENVSLAERLPQAMWRGRTQDKLYPYRDALRRRFVGCPKELKAAGRGADAALLSVLSPPVALQDGCDYRYNVYLESDAYASNLKQKMACGSLLVAPSMQFHEWWSRGLVPGQHYVRVTHEEDHVCEQTAQVVSDMNAAFAALGPAPASPAGSSPTPTLAQRTKQLRRDQPQLAALLPSGGSSGSGALGRAGAAQAGAVVPPQAGPGGNYSWGSSAMPWEVAAAGQAFVRDQVRVESALLYIRDLLKGYAALQRFKPRPVPKSVCYTGARLLEAFGHPYEEDANKVAAAYPWLEGYDGGCTEAEAKWGAF